MKWIVTILIAAFACPLAAYAQNGNTEDKKSEAAITFLKRIASGDLDVAKHTALSPNCSDARRKIIRERLKFLQSKYLNENDTLTVEAVKDDGRFSGVLIRAEHPSSPLTSRVLAIAMLRIENRWRAAPLLGSFTNTGYGYDEDVEKTVKNLESWMAREKIKRETNHRTKAANDFQSTLASIEKELRLEKADARKAVTNLIQHCRSKNLMHVLAAMGAASGVLTESLEDTVSNVSRGLDTDDIENDWQVITNRSAVFEIMNVDEKRNEVAVGFYNPMLRRQSKVLYFPVEKKNDKTFVKLSPMLSIAWLPQDERWQQRWRHRRDDERDLVLKIPATILKKIKVKPAETPDELLKRFLASVKSNNFRNAIELIPRKGHHFEKDKEQSIVLANLSTLWQGLINVKSSPQPKMSIIKGESVALAPVQYALPNNHGKFQTWNLWMLKDDSGWQLVPENSMKIIKDDKLRQSMKNLEKRLVSMTQVQRKELSKKMLSQVLKIDPAKLREPVTEQVARNLFKQYRSHLRGDDNEAALSSCAVMKGTDDTRTLKNFNYALRGVDDHIKDDRILGFATSGKWSGISVRTESRLAGTHDYPLYLCLNTHKGAKILLDIDLRHVTNKGRKMINTANWNKLKQAIPAEAFKDVESIFASHENLVSKDKEAEKKLHE
ncbi:MAG: hypothetical protein AB8F34_07180 [Akkermansiaceae bacterium]